MLQETVNSLEIKKNGIYIDLTFGGGGHPSASGMRVPNLKLFKNIAHL